MVYTKVAIRSKQFGSYVSMNGKGITHYREPPYKGTVNVMGHVQAWEIFNLHHNSDGTVSFEGSTFPNVFLTLDGNGVEVGTAVHGGGGYSAAQYTAKAWEKFYIRRQDNNTPAVFIECAAFPKRYLRIGGGILPKVVNVQGVADVGERMEIVVLG